MATRLKTQPCRLGKGPRLLALPQSLSPRLHQLTQPQHERNAPLIRAQMQRLGSLENEARGIGGVDTEPMQQNAPCVFS